MFVGGCLVIEVLRPFIATLKNGYKHFCEGKTLAFFIKGYFEGHRSPFSRPHEEGLKLNEGCLAGPP